MSAEPKPELARSDFPADFAWGVATASYQIEGAVNEDGRSPSIWDTFSHTPGKVDNDDTGDVACDHYHRYKEDVGLMSQLGLNSYRFSIAWPRIVPEGKGEINLKGVDFYARLVDELLEKNIQPYATLYHWDLPQVLEDKGGWSNRDTALYFQEYADKISRLLGDRVKGWITLNEPWVASILGYLQGVHAPGLHSMEKAVRATHHMLLAHGLAVPALRRNALRSDAEVGVTLSFNYIEPGRPGAEQLAQLKDAWDNRLFLDPLFKGAYPTELYPILSQYLPLEREDMEIISTPVDFMGVNYYFRTLPVEWADQATMSFKDRPNEGSEYTAMGWEIYPEGLYQLLTRFHRDYGIKKLYITENGSAFQDSVVEEDGNNFVHDAGRKKYLQEHFGAALRAYRDGVPLAGYFVWSLLDNFEWGYGYDKRFGIVYVDYPTQKRIIKDSAYWYESLLKSNA
ncbi:MAG: beta-glucosidase [Chloroflexi bacterium]|nr:beta-glucosidase [Chloroflexota bacterium]